MESKKKPSKKIETSNEASSPLTNEAPKQNVCRKRKAGEATGIKDFSSAEKPESKKFKSEGKLETQKSEKSKVDVSAVRRSNRKRKVKQQAGAYVLKRQD